MISSHSDVVHVQTNDDRGRHFVTTRKCFAGQVLVSSHSFAKAVFTELVGVVCDYCFGKSRTNTLFMRCSRCKSAYYCSPSCQKLDYAFHKLECKTGAIQKLQSRCRDPVPLLGLRTLLRKDLPSSGLTNEGTFDDVLSLASSDLIGGLSVNKLDHFTSCIGHALPEHVSTSKVRKILKRISCNAFTITDEELKPLGVGLYPAASFANHSCNPNAFFVFKETHIALIALHELEEGEEVVVNYVDLAEPLGSRREALRKQFSFICRCERCSEVDISAEDVLSVVSEIDQTTFIPKYTPTPEHWKVVEGILQQVKCQNCKGLGLLTRRGFVCNCSSPVAHFGYEKFLAHTHKARQLAVQLRWSECFDVLSEAKALNDEEQFLGRFHFEKRSFLIGLADCCVHLCKWIEAASAFRELIIMSKVLLPRNYPIIGIQEFALAKILSLLENNDKAALKAFRNAASVLTISHKACVPEVLAAALKGLEELSLSMKFSSEQ
ncbi:hypothetical protein P9112_011969 [Eukaryota sp. TZLM1-RC]